MQQSAIKFVARWEVCKTRSKTHKQLKEALFHQTIQDDANIQGSPLVQATNITKTNNDRNNLSAASWEDSSCYLGCVHETQDSSSHLLSFLSLVHTF